MLQVEYPRNLEDRELAAPFSYLLERRRRTRTRTNPVWTADPVATSAVAVDQPGRDESPKPPVLPFQLAACHEDHSPATRDGTLAQDGHGVPQTARSVDAAHDTRCSRETRPTTRNLVIFSKLARPSTALTTTKASGGLLGGGRVGGGGGGGFGGGGGGGGGGFAAPARPQERPHTHEQQRPHDAEGRWAISREQLQPADVGVVAGPKLPVRPDFFSAKLEKQGPPHGLLDIPQPGLPLALRTRPSTGYPPTPTSR